MIIMEKLIGLWAILLLGVGLGFAMTLNGLIQTEFIDFEINETLELDVELDGSYYLLYNNVMPTSYFDVSESTIYSLVEFPVSPILGEYGLFINVRQEITNDRFYLEGYGTQSSVEINGKDALGKFNLVEGSYDITITAATLDTIEIQDDFVFTIVPTSFIRDLLLSIFLGIGTIAFLVLFFVSYSIRQKHLNNMTDWNADYQSEPQDINKLYELDDDDIFQDYNKRR